MAELRDGRVKVTTFEASSVGIPAPRPDQISGGTPQQNAEITTAILRGEAGPRRDLVVINAGAALVAGEMAEDIREGIGLAARAIDSGAAFEKLEELRVHTRAA
jgi:anthranilate phosphoribosyltransferase